MIVSYKSVHLPATEIKTKDRKLPDWSDRLANEVGIATDVGDAKEEDSHSPPVFYMK